MKKTYYRTIVPYPNFYLDSQLMFKPLTLVQSCSLNNLITGFELDVITPESSPRAEWALHHYWHLPAHVLLPHFSVGMKE